MFERKYFEAKGPDRLNGQGAYVNPKTGRSYHINAGHEPSKDSHVGVHRPEVNLRETLKPRYYPLD